MKLTMTRADTLVLLLSFLAPSTPVPARVVINEVFYHAPDDRTAVQFVELLNAGEESVDIAGWKLEKGIRFTFPAEAKIAPGGYLVLCKDPEAFKTFYGAAPDGVFKGALGRGGDELELVDAAGKRVDAVKYEDRAPWPIAPDGYSASLERVSPAASGELPHNWAPSASSADGTQPGGTPGRRNDSYSENLPPTVEDLRVTPASPRPGEALTVEARVTDPDGLGDVFLAYRLVASGSEAAEETIAMARGEGDRYTARIPGQAGGSLIRFRLRAVDRAGAVRWHPSPREPRPAFSSYVLARPDLARIPGAIIVNTTPEGFAAARRAGRGGRGPRGPFGDPAMGQRLMATQVVESRADLEGAWWSLVFVSGIDAGQAAKLAPAFARGLDERQKLVDELAEAADFPGRMDSLEPSLVALRGRLAAAAAPILGEAAGRRFAEELARGGPARRPGGPFFGGGPERMLRQAFDVEGQFLMLAARAGLTEPQFGKLKPVLEEAAAERAKLAREAEAAMREEGGGFQEVEQKLGALTAMSDKKIAAELTTDQQSQLNRWRSENSGPPWARRGRGRSAAAGPGNQAFVFIDPETGDHTVFDFVKVVPRSGGFKVRFHKDQALRGMTTINLLFEYLERFVLAEPLAYELYRRAGNAACLTDFVRLVADDRLLGYHLLVEQPNRSFLRRNQLRDDGNLYKILWYERGVVGQHEKKTNVHGGQDDHDDIVEIVELLGTLRGEEQWAAIKKHFDVEQVINYFAVNTCLSHWDGFFNNYFTYHDVRGTGKWTLYPWDQDKTWGFHDGLERGQVFHDMPITFGMEGDRPPGGRPGRGRGFFGGGGGGGAWWRAPGHFSGPLLANPSFRKLFLARTRELLETLYTEEVFFPLIARLGAELEPEVPIRAKALGEDPLEARERLAADLQSLREHLIQRRKFLLAEEEVRSAGPFEREALK
jgi:hypothetical protein